MGGDCIRLHTNSETVTVTHLELDFSTKLQGLSSTELGKNQMTQKTRLRLPRRRPAMEMKLMV